MYKYFGILSSTKVEIKQYLNTFEKSGISTSTQAEIKTHLSKVKVLTYVYICKYKY